MAHALMERVVLGETLSEKESQKVFEALIAGQVPEIKAEAFLRALSLRGETVGEVVGALTALRAHAKPCAIKSPDAVDVCGTGGDQKNTFNVSTAVAFVVAGAGVPVAKHGNRAVSSRSGSADVLQALGVNVDTPAEKIARCVDEIGIGFLFAPNFHPVLKNLAAVRKKVGKSIFNLLGPLLNPAHVPRQVVGVYNRKFLPLIAGVLQKQGSRSFAVVCGDDGLDEITLTTTSALRGSLEGKGLEEIFDPRSLGYEYCTLKDLEGGTAEENALRLKKVLKGHSLPLDHCVHLNAALALRVAGKAQDFKEGVLLAQESISSGRAYQKLETLIEMTNDLSCRT